MSESNPVVGGVGVTASTVATTFQYRPQPDGTCSCPIHQGCEREPFTAPLGLPFADHVTVEPIRAETAGAIYDAHHGYMDGVPAVNLEHHGLYYQGQLVGAITWRYPLLRKKAVRYDDRGRLLPEPVAIDADLPAELRPTARRVLAEIDPADVAERVVVDGDAFVEASRICIGVAMPNLASAALARSQERLVADHGHRGVIFLRTLVWAEYSGSMIRALRDKGWTCTGYCEPGQAGNRSEKPIRERYKWRFTCPVDRVREQADLGRWT